MNRFFVLFIILVSGCSLDKSGLNQLTEQERWDRHVANTEIIRDDFGIPHVYGKTDADAVFGLLYAQCEDDFSRVEQNYIWATGRLAEVEGEDAIYSDLRANLFMTQAEAEEMYAESPEWLQKLCMAFADGVNYYLSQHPEVKPKLLTRFEPWMPMFFSEGSIGGDIERISTRAIRNFYENNRSLAEVEIVNQLDDVLVEPQGSNGIAISGKLTESGNTLLLINPHTSFYFRGEVHMVSEEGLNAYGAVTWGQFFIYQGFNEKTGWIHTSTYTDVMDQYKEEIVTKDDELYYQYGDELRPVEISEIKLKYLDGESLKEKSFTMYKTHHGPITQLEGDQWVASAMMWEPVKALEQSYIRTKQSGYTGFREMMDIRTNSSNNTVYADTEGNIAYFHGNFIPIRDTRFDFTQAVDGSDPDTDWKGLHPVSDHITLLNPKNGWIQNCNSTPFTAALEYSPKREDYPGYMSIDRENFRGVHAIGLLNDREGYTIDNLIELAYDPYLPAFKALIPGLVQAYDNTGKEKELSGPIEHLRNWDFKTSKESVAMTLAHYYGTTYYSEGKRPEGLTSMELMEYWGSNSPLEERVRIFEMVISRLETDFGDWEMSWGEVNRYQRLTSDIRQLFDDNQPSIPVGFASGRWGALAAYGARYSNNTKKMYGTRGNSFVAVVEFGDKVKAKSILAGGQSGNPDSPHFDDQAQMYADVQFKTVSFYKEDVVNQAKFRYRPGDEY